MNICILVTTSISFLLFLQSRMELSIDIIDVDPCLSRRDAEDERRPTHLPSMRTCAFLLLPRWSGPRTREIIF